MSLIALKRFRVPARVWDICAGASASSVVFIVIVESARSSHNERRFEIEDEFNRYQKAINKNLFDLASRIERGQAVRIELSELARQLEKQRIDRKNATRSGRPIRMRDM